MSFGPRMSESLIDQDSGLGKLCSTCRDIFNRWDTTDRPEILESKDISYYDDPRMWIASADDGCVFCIRMLDGLERVGAAALCQSLALGTEIRMQTRLCSSLSGVNIYSQFSLARVNLWGQTVWEVEQKFNSASTDLVLPGPGTIDYFE
jgi:hypothetical protein